jgi:hypothetical protein
MKQLVTGWKQTYSGDPSLDGPDPDSDPDTWICADFDHSEEGDPKTGYFRVWSSDLNIFVANWKTNPAPDCQDCQEGQGRQAGGQPRDTEEMLKWLEGILVDEEMKKLIGEKNWDEFVKGVKGIIESLKEELEE